MPNSELNMAALLIYIVACIMGVAAVATAIWTVYSPEVAMIFTGACGVLIALSTIKEIKNPDIARKVNYE